MRPKFKKKAQKSGPSLSLKRGDKGDFLITFPPMQKYNQPCPIRQAGLTRETLGYNPCGEILLP